jgi:hypothetical protein
MSQDLRERIESLERANHLWKVLALISCGVLGLVLLACIGLGVLQAITARALAERELAAQRMAEEALAASKQAERDLVAREQVHMQAQIERECLVIVLAVGGLGQREGQPWSALGTVVLVERLHPFRQP